MDSFLHKTAMCNFFLSDGGCFEAGESPRTEPFSSEAAKAAPFPREAAKVAQFPREATTPLLSTWHRLRPYLSFCFCFNAAGFSALAYWLAFGSEFFVDAASRLYKVWFRSEALLVIE